MPKVRGYLLFTLIFLQLVAGCIPVAATPSPTPLPTATMTPTHTPTPVPTPTPTAMPSPTPTAVPPPARPAEFNDYPSVIVEYLTASQGDDEGMTDFLTGWGALVDLRQADLDADDSDEIVLVIQDSTVTGYLFPPNNLLVVDSHEGGYRLLFLLAGGGEEVWEWPLGVEVLEVSDVNADSGIDLAFTTQSCGAHTCYVMMNLLTWDGAEFISLFPEPIENAYGEYWFEDIDGDQALELLMHGDVIGSVGAGPQRARTDTYDWDGALYQLVESVYDESPFLFHKVVDADEAALDGDYEAAIALYREAIDNPDLVVWKEWLNNGETERADMHGYARYRLVVVYALLGQRSKAQEALEEVEREQPDHVYAGVVQAFWDGYTLDDDVAAGCAAVTAYAAEHPAALEAFSEFGYANPIYTLEDVCPFGGA